MLQIPLFALSGALIALSSGVMAIVMFSVGKEKQNFLWGIFCLSVFVWGLGGFFIGTTTDATSADTWWRLTHIGIAFIPVLFLHFVYTFLNRKTGYVIFSFYFIAIAFAILALFSNLLIAHMRFVFGEFYYDSPPGLFYPLFTVYFFGLAFFSHVLLYQKYKTEPGTSPDSKMQRTRIMYFFLATLVGFSGGSLSFLPVYQIDIYPILNFTVVLYPIIMGYAILRHRLFDIRVAAAQGFIVLLWIFVGLRLAFSLSLEETFLNGALFAVVIVLGIFFVRSVAKEVEQRERIERLSEEKSEFMSFASHEIRNPLTAMRGYASLIVDGTVGEVSTQVRDVAQKILVNGDTVLSLISEFLNKSKVELGQISYSVADVDVGKVIQSISEGLKPHAREKGLTLEVRIDFLNLIARADEAKLREVVGNLIDNSVKYTKSGSITVAVEKRNGMARITISDTGVGIPPETITHLFQKFSRADAQKMNLLGTGLGLYLAKTFIEGMGGKIWAESDGKDKGSRFIIELHTV